jgi:uncharacterized protein
LLTKACADHTHERTLSDITIQTCWDADRLGLGRVDVTPHPDRLCTDVAKDPAMIRWADGQASFGVVPKSATDEWWEADPILWTTNRLVLAVVRRKA